MHLCPMQPIPSWAGSVGGRALRGRGVLLDHKAAALASEEAREQARMRVQLRHVRDWVLDYSEPGAIWVISDWAWYRCVILMPDLHWNLITHVCIPLGSCPGDMPASCLTNDTLCLRGDACYQPSFLSRMLFAAFTRSCHKTVMTRESWQGHI